MSLYVTRDLRSAIADPPYYAPCLRLSVDGELRLAYLLTADFFSLVSHQEAVFDARWRAGEFPDDKAQLASERLITIYNYANEHLTVDEVREARRRWEGKWDELADFVGEMVPANDCDLPRWSEPVVGPKVPGGMRRMTGK